MFDLDAALERIKEIHAQPHAHRMEWYGIGRSVRRFLGLPAWMPLYISTTHGPLVDGHIPLYEQTHDRPQFVQNDEVAQTLRTVYGREAYPSGCFYVRHRRLNNIEQDANAAGTLAFPSHSTHLVEMEFDWSRYARMLNELPDHFKPITVCLYWKELLQGAHVVLQEAGFEVVTAGHMFDPNFMDNLYQLLRRHRYTTGNTLGTHVVLSLEMGLPYLPFGDRCVWHSPGGSEQEVPAGRFDEIDSRPARRAFYRLLPQSPESDVAISPELAAHVRQLHGCDAPVDVDLLRRITIRQYLRRSEQARDFWKLLGDRRDLLDLADV